MSNTTWLRGCLGQSVPLRGATAEEEGGAVERLEIPKEPTPVLRKKGGRRWADCSKSLSYQPLIELASHCVCGKGHFW